jgi:hypothetical protein
MTKETGGPVFPREYTYEGHAGTSLRDYFAAKALEGILAGDHPITHEADPQVIAEAAYLIADEMLKVRKL